MTNVKPTTSQVADSSTPDNRSTIAERVVRMIDEIEAALLLHVQAVPVAARIVVQAMPELGLKTTGPGFDSLASTVREIDYVTLARIGGDRRLAWQHHPSPLEMATGKKASIALLRDAPMAVRVKFLEKAEEFVAAVNEDLKRSELGYEQAFKAASAALQSLGRGPSPEERIAVERIVRAASYFVGFYGGAPSTLDGVIASIRDLVLRTRPNVDKMKLDDYLRGARKLALEEVCDDAAIRDDIGAALRLAGLGR